MNKKLTYLLLFLTGVLSFAMHYRHLDKELVSMHVWRQIQTQSNINNFYEEDMNILNPRRNARGDGDGIYRMEFPLMQWLVAGSYFIFGERILVTRVFMFIIGLFSIFGMFRLLQALFDKPAPALIGAWAFTFSPTFYYYMINPFPDNLALCLAIWGTTVFFSGYRSGSFSSLFWSSLLLSLSALCKLPFILYFIVPATYLLLQVRRQGFTRNNIRKTAVAAAFFILPFGWYLAVIPQWTGNGIVTGLLNNQLSLYKSLDYLWHAVVSNLPELLLNYGSLPLFLAGFYFLYRNKSTRDPRFKLLLLWGMAVIAYYLFEFNMIGKSHDYYLFPFLPLLFILVGYGGWNLGLQSSKLTRTGVVVLLALLPFTCHLRMINRWNLDDPGFNRSLLEHREALQRAVPDDALVVAGNDDSYYIMLYYIDKKGWGFQQNVLTPEALQAMISSGATYLYSDSRWVESQEGMESLLEQLVAEYGNIRIYRLKDLKN